MTTPEGVRLFLTPAGPATRAFAWAIDLAVWLTFVSLSAYLFRGGYGFDNKFGFGIFLLALFVSFWGYPILCEVYWGGQTLGKRALGIEVLRADGLPVGWRESTLRNLMLVADFLPAFYASGLICMFCDSSFKRLGDIVAGTQVVYCERAAQRAATTLVAPIALPFPLTPEEQRTLVDLFEREPHLPMDRLIELGGIAEPLTGRSGAASLERLRGYVASLTQ